MIVFKSKTMETNLLEIESSKRWKLRAIPKMGGNLNVHSWKIMHLHCSLSFCEALLSHYDGLYLYKSLKALVKHHACFMYEKFKNDISSVKGRFSQMTVNSRTYRSMGCLSSILVRDASATAVRITVIRRKYNEAAEITGDI